MVVVHPPGDFSTEEIFYPQRRRRDRRSGQKQKRTSAAVVDKTPKDGPSRSACIRVAERHRGTRGKERLATSCKTWTGNASGMFNHSTHQPIHHLGATVRIVTHCAVWTRARSRFSVWVVKMEAQKSEAALPIRVQKTRMTREHQGMVR